MSTIKTAKVQTGISNTPSNNFHTRAPEDGTWRLSRGNAEAPLTDVLIIDSSGNFTAAPVLGTGQTWQDLTGSRAPSTFYTNTTGRPIMVAVTLASGNYNVYLEVNGVRVTGSTGIGSGTIVSNITAIVPAGATYRTFNFGSLVHWAELR